MAKYHLTEQGEAALCTATTRPCPRGEAEDHYPTAGAAREAFEQRQMEQAKHLRPLRKSKEKTPFEAFAQGLTKAGERLEVAERSGYQVVEALVLPAEERGKGRGGELMRALVQEADAQGVKLALTPSKDFGATSTARLTRFYKQFGFVENKGRHKDYSTREVLLRQPRPLTEASSSLPTPSEAPQESRKRPLPPPPDLSTAALQEALKARGVTMPLRQTASPAQEVPPHPSPGRVLTPEEEEKARQGVEELAEFMKKQPFLEQRREGLRHHPRFTLVGEGVDRLAVVDRETNLVLKYPKVGPKARQEAKATQEEAAYQRLQKARLAEENIRYASTYFFKSQEGVPVMVQEYLDPVYHRRLEPEYLSEDAQELLWGRESAAVGVWDVNDRNAVQETTGSRTVVLLDCLPLESYPSQEG